MPISPLSILQWPAVHWIQHDFLGSTRPLHALGQAEEVAAGRPPRKVSPWAWRGLAFLSGVVASLVLHRYTGRATFGPGPGGVVAFGLVAGVISIVGRDGLKTVLSWFGLAASPSVVVQPLPGPAVPVQPLPPGPPAEELRPATAEDLTRMTGTALPAVELEWPLLHQVPDDSPVLDTGSRADRI